MKASAIASKARRQERQQEREQKRDIILRVAAELFARQGYKSTSVDDLTRALELTKPTLYHYFKNKDQILYECARLGLERLDAAHRAIMQGPGTGLDKLCQFLRQYAAVIETDLGRCYVRIGDHELARDSRTRLRAMKAQIDSKLRQIIVQAVDDESIAPCDPKITAFALAGLINSIGQWYQPNTGLSGEEIVERFLTLIVNGLSPRTA